MADPNVESAHRTLPPEGSVNADQLRALPEGSLVVTYGVGWAKTGPDEWRSPFRLHVPDMSVAAKNQRFVWHDVKDSEWLAEVATLVVFNPAEWGL